MIITLKGADFSASNIGTLSSWRITRSLGAGATYEGVTSVDKDASFSATVTIAEGYELGTAGVTVTMGGNAISAATVNGNVITISISSVTGNVVIKVPTVNLSTGEEEEPEVPDIPGDEPVQGYWLSNRLADDPSKHDSYMAATDLNGELTSGYDIIFYTSDVQSLLDGNLITQLSCGNLGDNGILTLYSNPWTSDGTLSIDGRTVIGTVTGMSNEGASGSFVKTYDVANPLPIKAGETLAISWAPKLKTVDNGKGNGYVAPVKYKQRNGTTYETLIINACLFDLFVEVK